MGLIQMSYSVQQQHRQLRWMVGSAGVFPPGEEQRDGPGLGTHLPSDGAPHRLHSSGCPAER